MPEIGDLVKDGWIDSYDLYIECGCNRKHYSRWIKEVVRCTYNLVDYKEVSIKENPNRKIKYRYYLSIDLAATLCFNIKTVISLRIRRKLLSLK